MGRIKDKIIEAIEEVRTDRLVPRKGGEISAPNLAPRKFRTKEETFVYLTQENESNSGNAQDYVEVYDTVEEDINGEASGPNSIRPEKNGLHLMAGRVKFAGGSNEGDTLNLGRRIDIGYFVDGFVQQSPLNNPTIDFCIPFYAGDSSFSIEASNRNSDFKITDGECVITRILTQPSV